MVFDFTCLATRKAKRRSLSSASLGARLVTVLSCISSTTALSRDCTSRPPATVFAVQPKLRGSGRPPASSKPQVLLRRDDLDRFVAGVGRDDDLGEDLGDRLRGFGVERAVERDNAAERGRGIASERFLVGVEQARAFGDAARVGVLDDDAGRGALGVELGDAFVGGVGVVDIVVGQLLALQLARGGDAGTLAWRAVERRALVRVLAVAQRLNQFAAEGAVVRRVVVQRVGEPVRDRRIVSRGARVGLGRKMLAQLE